MGMKLCAYLVGLIGIVAVVLIAYPYQFRLENIRMDGRSETIIHLENDQSAILNELIQQPFAYLDRGRQSFAFVNQDHQYVLKFFDTRCLHPKRFLFFPISVRPSCQRKVKRLLDGYRLAYERDRQNTGLILVQPTPNPQIIAKVTLIDRFGFRHVVNLGKVPFIIQVKAIPTRIVLTDRLNKGDIAGAVQRLRQIIDMYLDEYSKGIFDRDHNFMYNTGFVGNCPIRIDVGRLRADERYKQREVYEADLRKVALQRVGEWMQRHFPQYREAILADMKVKLQEVTRGGS